MSFARSTRGVTAATVAEAQRFVRFCALLSAGESHSLLQPSKHQQQQREQRLFLLSQLYCSFDNFDCCIQRTALL